MIEFRNITKSFWTPNGRKVIAEDLNLRIPSGVSVALLGRNGAGKSTIMEMIGGRMRADSGEIVTTGTVSWPVGFAGSFHGDMTGAQNVRFIARVYGVDTDALVAFVADFAELGDHFQLPVRTYSGGMKSRLAFGMSIGIPFDTYLVDEVTSVGDAAFKLKARKFFEARMETAGAVVVSHSTEQLRLLCSAGIVLDKGQASYHDDIEAAISHYQESIGTKVEQ